MGVIFPSLPIGVGANKHPLLLQSQLTQNKMQIVLFFFFDRSQVLKGVFILFEN